MPFGWDKWRPDGYRLATVRSSGNRWKEFHKSKKLLISSHFDEGRALILSGFQVFEAGDWSALMASLTFLRCYYSKRCARSLVKLLTLIEAQKMFRRESVCYKKRKKGQGEKSRGKYFRFVMLSWERDGEMLANKVTWKFAWSFRWRVMQSFWSKSWFVCL